jgi:hypothetical protein
MATEWYLMGSKPVYNSGFEQEDFESYAKDSFSELLDTSPISKTVRIINPDFSAISEIKAFILNNTSDSLAQDDIRQILTVVGTLRCGDYILFDNDVWIVSSFIGNNGMNEKAIMQLCNYTLKFQSKINGAILSYPCIKTTSNTIGIQENKIIDTPDGTVYIELPFDSETKLLDVDDRFFIDDLSVPIPQVYSVSKPDRTSTVGIVKLTMKQDAYNKDTDDKELGVCNYIKPTEPDIPVVGTSYANITCSNSLNEITLGSVSYYSLTPTFYEAGGTLATNITALWSWTYPIGYSESAFEIIYVGNIVKIKVSDAYSEDYGLLGLTIKANVMSSNGGYSDDIILTIVI